MIKALKSLRFSKVLLCFSISVFISTAFFIADTQPAQAEGTTCENNNTPVPIIMNFNPVLFLGDTATFSAQSSFDIDGDPLSYLWAINSEGIQQTGETFEFTPSREGTYIVTLVVGDDCGAWDVTWTIIDVQKPIYCRIFNQKPTSVINPIAPSIEVGQTVNFDSSNSSDPEGGSLSFLWAVNQLGMQQAGETFDFTPTEPGDYVVTLVVGDPCGDWDVTWTVVHVEGPELKPDLTILSAEPGVLEAGGIFFPGRVPQEGELPGFLLTIKNIGTAPSGEWELGDASEGRHSKLYPLPSIAPGEIYAVKYGVPLEGVGEHLVTFTVDPDDLIDELDETNNSLTEDILIEKVAVTP